MKLALTRLIEIHIGNLICFLLGIFTRHREKPEHVESLLVVRDWSLGESLLALPMIRSYRDSFPTAKITVLVSATSKPVFEQQSFIDELIDFNLPNVLKLLCQRRFDLAVDAMPYFRHSAIIARICSGYCVGFDTARIRSRLYDQKISFDDSIHMVRMMTRLNVFSQPEVNSLVPVVTQVISNSKINDFCAQGQPLIGVHLGTSETAQWRAWKLDNFISLIRHILSQYPQARIFLSGSHSEAEVNESVITRLDTNRVINLAKQCNLHEFAGLLTRTDLFVSSDTGPMHVAASMGCKTIGLFGPETPVRFGPFPPNQHIALWNPPEDYQPIINVHRAEFGSKSHPHKDVINRITVDMVFSQVCKILLDKTVQQIHTPVAHSDNQ